MGALPTQIPCTNRQVWENFLSSFAIQIIRLLLWLTQLKYIFNKNYVFKINTYWKYWNYGEE
jgi:hypothetical protein